MKNIKDILVVVVLVILGITLVGINGYVKEAREREMSELQISQQEAQEQIDRKEKIDSCVAEIDTSERFLPSILEAGSILAMTLIFFISIIKSYISLKNGGSFDFLAPMIIIVGMSILLLGKLASPCRDDSIRSEALLIINNKKP